MIVLRSFLLLATAACLGVLGYAGYTAYAGGDPVQMLNELQELIASTWVQALLASYYLGVLCFIGAIVVIEKRLLTIILWSLAALLITYPALVFWLLLRGLPEMGERSSRRLRSLG
ncbi:MAG: hypothetical protein ACLFSI_00150 [Halorhodospira sp.]